MEGLYLQEAVKHLDSIKQQNLSKDEAVTYADGLDVGYPTGIYQQNPKVVCKECNLLNFDYRSIKSADHRICVAIAKYSSINPIDFFKPSLHNLIIY